MAPPSLYLATIWATQWGRRGHAAPHCLGVSRRNIARLLTIQIAGINLPGNQHSASIWSYICRSLVALWSPPGLLAEQLSEWIEKNKQKNKKNMNITMLENNYRCKRMTRRQHRARGPRGEGKNKKQFQNLFKDMDVKDDSRWKIHK